MKNTNGPTAPREVVLDPILQLEKPIRQALALVESYQSLLDLIVENGRRPPSDVVLAGMADLATVTAANLTATYASACEAHRSTLGNPPLCARA